MNEAVGKVGIVTYTQSGIKHDVDVTVPNVVERPFGYPDFILELVTVDW
jgi:hypothetical protein